MLYEVITISKEVKKELCPYCLAQKVIKGKWKLLIFWHLQQGTKRFNELSRLIPATQATITKQLRELELDDVVERKIYEVIPPKVEYSLTPLGVKFGEVTFAMNQWGTLYFQEMGLLNNPDKQT